MRRLKIPILFALLLLPTAHSSGQPGPIGKGDVVAPAVAPKVYMATAAQRGGEVVIRVSAPGMRLTNKDKDGKGWVYCWTEMAAMTLDKQVLAYNPAGKRLDRKAVVKALIKPVLVVCFIRMTPHDPKRPDPAYAGVFKDGTVLLVFGPFDNTKAKDLLR
ncbi:MAG: hypothetical protein HYX68_15895 [Planctomycetes bacterium]|jgi:hypothetical protein|nr:hypothetical protein [Planctomycetota bacterium]